MVTKGSLLILCLIGLACAQSDCISQPWNQACSGFTMSDATLDAKSKSACDMMYMSGCTLVDNCADASLHTTYNEYCSSFSLYKSVCMYMSGMMDCQDYRSMCLANETFVEQCDTKTLPILSAMRYRELIDGICVSMNNGMDGCECQGDACDLTVYSKLCLAMPSMPECESWKSICSVVPKWPLCANNAVNPTPGMMMYFHDGIYEYFLFESIVPTDYFQYWLLLGLIFVLAVFYETIKLFTYVASRFFLDGEIDDTDKKGIPKWNFVGAAITSGAHFVETLLGSALMLVIMTFNIGIFFAYVLGRTVGMFIVGDRLSRATLATTAECH